MGKKSGAFLDLNASLIEIKFVRGCLEGVPLVAQN